MHPDCNEAYRILLENDQNNIIHNNVPDADENNPDAGDNNSETSSEGIEDDDIFEELELQFQDIFN